MIRVLLSTVYRPFCGDEPFDSPLNQVQHGTCHRQFTREQGIFTIHQQCSNLALHLIAANIRAETDVVEYPDLEEFERILLEAVQAGRPYDYVGISAPASYIRKARHLCQLVKRHSPQSATVLGGGGALAVGEEIEPFADHNCLGEGVRFFRELLGQDQEAPIKHPTVPSIHFPNRIMGSKANPPSFSLAVSLGCDRRCEFCSTSAQFGGRRIPVLRSGSEIFAAMKQVENELRESGGPVPYIYFIIFDENFLTDKRLSREFLELNREQMKEKTLFLPFLFADATNVRKFKPEELLEMGVDAIWIGLETSKQTRFAKNRGVDFKKLIQELQDNGIKVFISFVAGLEDHTRASIEQDIEYALTLGAAGFQYSILCPLPGTPLYKRLKNEGLLDVQRPEQLNMSHYYIRHPELNDDLVREKTTEFQRRDYERHGPLALRYMKLRLDGYVRHRHSDNPALRARARGFRNDLMDAAPVLEVGSAFAPTPGVKQDFIDTHRRLGREIKILPALLDTVRGRLTLKTLLKYALFTNRLIEPAARWGLVWFALTADPRSREQCRTLAGLLRNGKACIEEVKHGVMPWEQPSLVMTCYPESHKAAAGKSNGRFLQRLKQTLTGAVPAYGGLQ